MSDLQEGPLNPVGPAPAPKPSRRDERRRRRMRRRRGEEILGWVLVPVIVLSLYWGVSSAFDMLNTSPGQVWDQLMQVKAMMEKRGV